MNKRVWKNKVLLTIFAIVLAFTSIPNVSLFGMANKVEAAGIPSSGNWDVSGICTYTFSNGILTIFPGKGTEVDMFTNFTREQLESIQTIILSDGITAIRRGAFFNCSNVTGVTFPDSLKTIENESFGSATKLNRIYIPAGVEEIEPNIFCNSHPEYTVADGNEYYKSVDGVLYDKSEKKLVSFPSSRSGEVSVQSSVTEIGDYAFSNCHEITNVIIPDGVTSIGNYAFLGCFNMTNTVIPNNVISIGDYAYKNCVELKELVIPEKVSHIGASICCNGWKLTRLEVAKNNAFYKTVDGVLYNKSGTELLCYPYAYAREQDNECFVVPNDVKIVAKSAFESAVNLSEIILPVGLTTIEDFAFRYDNIQEITIPDSVTYIGGNCFYRCENLTKITLPKNLETIAWYAFNECNSLTDVFYKGTQSDWEKINIERGGEYITNASIHFNDGTILNERDYTVKYNANGGSGSMTSQAFVGGIEQNLKENAFTRTGYTFTGWNTKADGTGTSYADKESVVNLTTTNGEIVTLYAQWNQMKFTVAFNMNGHGTAPANQEVGYGNTIAQPAVPTAEGYYFQGWYKEAPCVTAWRFPVDTVTSDVTLYAKWVAIPEKEPIVEEEPSEEPTVEEPAPEEPGLPENMNDNGDGTFTVEDGELGETKINAAVVTEGMVYRMYNPNTGEHFYTKDASERESLMVNGWNYEENASFETISATEDGAVPVYRVYNPNSGLHHYTMSKDEALMLKDLGWNYEGISLYVYDANSEFGTPEYRLYNENDGHHHWTVDSNERDALVALGWNDEGVAWRVK